MKRFMPIKSYVNPDELEDLQEWACENAQEMHDTSVEAAYLLMQSTATDEVVIVQFIWEDEVYSDLILNRKDAPASLANAIEYYVSTEQYESAARAKSILETLARKTQS